MSVLNDKYIQENLLNSPEWLKGHAADNGQLGLGLIYYSLVYSLAFEKVVCLGSGNGFVPRLMAQAFRDLGKAGEVHLVDANNGQWGRPIWVQEDSFLRTNFPEIKIHIKTTDDAASMFGESNTRFDWCHIDANHSHANVTRDFLNYSALLNRPNGIITIHDTLTKCGVPEFIAELSALGEWNIIKFNIGAGLALITRGENG